MIILKVTVRSKTIRKMNCLSWNRSARTWMFISSNHLMVTVLCIQWISSSCSTFKGHRGVIHHLVQPLTPFYVLYKWKKNTRGLTTPQYVHPYGTRSKTQATTMKSQTSSEGETEHPSTLESSLEDTENLGVMGNLFNCISTKLWQ